MKWAVWESKTRKGVEPEAQGTAPSAMFDRLMQHLEDCNKGLTTGSSDGVLCIHNWTIRQSLVVMQCPIQKLRDHHPIFLRWEEHLGP